MTGSYAVYRILSNEKESKKVTDQEKLVRIQGIDGLGLFITQIKRSKTDRSN